MEPSELRVYVNFFMNKYIAIHIFLLDLHIRNHTTALETPRKDHSLGLYQLQCTSNNRANQVTFYVAFQSYSFCEHLK